MIDYIKGDIAELTPTSATLETHGIGYFINISLNTYTSISGQKSAKLYIYEAIREDAYQLYGFSEKHIESWSIICCFVNLPVYTSPYCRRVGIFPYSIQARLMVIIF